MFSFKFHLISLLLHDDVYQLYLIPSIDGIFTKYCLILMVNVGTLYTPVLWIGMCCNVFSQSYMENCTAVGGSDIAIFCYLPRLEFVGF